MLILRLQVPFLRIDIRSMYNACPLYSPTLDADLTKYNKWMFTDGQLNFHFPLFTTAMHMIVQFFLALLVLAIFPQLRPRHDSLDDPDEPPKPIEEPSKPIMTLWFYLTRITPCAMSTGLDIGLGNTSLRFVTLVFFSESLDDSAGKQRRLSCVSDVQVVHPGICSAFRYHFPP